jgi:hypothetical protein
MLDSSCGPRDRVSRMGEMTRVFMDKAKRHQDVHEAVGQVMGIVQITSAVVGSMLAAYPPAALAWSGICAILPVWCSQPQVAWCGVCS